MPTMIRFIWIWIWKCEIYVARFQEGKLWSFQIYSAKPSSKHCNIDPSPILFLITLKKVYVVIFKIVAFDLLNVDIETLTA